MEKCFKRIAIAITATVMVSWVAVEGYTNSGSYFKIVDPAAGITGFESVPQKYTVSKSSVQNYISYGIIW